MNKKVNVVWSFEETEFENFQYEEARKSAGLPASIVIDIEEDDEEIDVYAYENFGFEISEWEYID